MSYVDVTPDVADIKGEPVVTAGESLPGTNDTSPYPPGLLIGTYPTVHAATRNAVVQSATIAPAAHLTDATFLLVITRLPGRVRAADTVGLPEQLGQPGELRQPGRARPARAAPADRPARRRHRSADGNTVRPS